MRFRDFVLETAVARKTSYVKGAPGRSSGIPGYKGKETIGSQGSSDAAFARDLTRDGTDVAIYKERLAKECGPEALERLSARAEALGSTLDAAVKIAIDRDIEPRDVLAKFGA